MDSLTTKYRGIVEQVLQEYADFLGQDDQVQKELIFDQNRDRYLLIETGWHNGDRVYDTLIHIDIINEKLWIQHDGTEDGIAYELEAAGTPKNHISDLAPRNLNLPPLLL
ncbi:XisI protein [Trichocoleus sp. FACHB-591]|uniref:XisI protein n=1 Tax=Trichocoleus sp. FACHB-591 TaxID=2692872 RepID=UPI00168732BA|nr:XisI protein [Trichocoleus sp. FACHB-591]MBD2094275.1 XisI protein [Trichocoleus sp. FACHB-591]